MCLKSRSCGFADLLAASCGIFVGFSSHGVFPRDECGVEAVHDYTKRRGVNLGLLITDCRVSDVDGPLKSE